MAKYRSREMATNVKLLTPTDTPTNRSHENTDRLYMRNNPPPQCLLKKREPKAKRVNSGSKLGFFSIDGLIVIKLGCVHMLLKVDVPFIMFLKVCQKPFMYMYMLYGFLIQVNSSFIRFV